MVLVDNCWHHAGCAKSSAYHVHWNLFDEPVPAKPASPDAYSRYFLRHAEVLQAEHRVAKQQHTDTQYQCVVQDKTVTHVNNAEDPTAPPSSLYVVEVRFHRNHPEVTEGGRLCVHAGEEQVVDAKVVQHRVASQGVARVVTLWLEHTSEELHSDLAEGDHVVVQTRYNNVPLTRELLALHKFVFASRDGTAPFHIVPDTPEPDPRAAAPANARTLADHREFEELNENQRSAVHNVLVENRAVTVVHGPPGTGKSKTLVALA